ncbi:hypothetical protein [Thauera butanivorans]|jgi:nitronate monooxygenase|nr:hypothetical protein [Thauera butanivorans]
MPIPEMFRGRLALPLIGSPMFLASGQERVQAGAARAPAGASA